MSNRQRPPRQVSVAAPAIALAGATVLLLAGGWLMFAPFAFGYQPSGADWTDATTTDFYTGAGIAAAALLAGVALAAQLPGRLRALDRTRTATSSAPGHAEDDAEGPGSSPVQATEEPAPEPESTPAPAASAETSEVATVLAPLVEALIHDLSGARETPEPTRNGSYQPIAGGERS
ncbi:MAG: hypothetical protein ACRDMV_19500 [Streptosporangiales bacterium]